MKKILCLVLILLLMVGCGREGNSDTISSSNVDIEVDDIDIEKNNNSAMTTEENDLANSDKNITDEINQVGNEKYDFDIFTIFNLVDKEVLDKLGESYEIVPTGAEGSYDGYYYNELGIIIVFDFYGNIEFIDCTEEFSIDGARTGMSFEEIQSILGQQEIEEGWYETQDNLVYKLTYSINDLVFEFMFLEQDLKNAYLKVYQDKQKKD